MDPFPSPAGWWVKRCHHHSTLIALNTNVLKRQMDPTGKRRRREYFMRWTCTDRSGKGKGSQDIHAELFPKLSVLITCEIHDINSGTWLQFLVLPPSFECVVTAWAGSWEFSLFVVTNTQKRQRKVVFSSMKQQRKKANVHVREVSCCVVQTFLG